MALLMWPRNMDTSAQLNIASKDNTFGFEAAPMHKMERECIASPPGRGTRWSFRYRCVCAAPVLDELIAKFAGKRERGKREASLWA
ncbi:hypothetical protein FHG87_001904 [Trinorchestia longiramus]|nr:hypothetical protein FHG87_001904 [Trinorchestia longiramus]